MAFSSFALHFILQILKSNFFPRRQSNTSYHQVYHSWQAGMMKVLYFYFLKQKFQQIISDYGQVLVFFICGQLAHESSRDWRCRQKFVDPHCGREVSFCTERLLLCLLRHIFVQESWSLVKAQWHSGLQRFTKRSNILLKFYIFRSNPTWMETRSSASRMTASESWRRVSSVVSLSLLSLALH